MGIVRDTGGYGTAAANTVSIALTIAANVDRYLIVGVEWVDLLGTTSISSITWNTTENLTQLVTKNQGIVRTALWGLASPTAATANVVVTMSAVTRVVAGAISWFGVNLVTSVGSTGSAAGLGSGPSLSVTTTQNEMVVDSMAADGGSYVNATVGAGQTEEWNANRGTTPTNSVRGCGSYELATSTTVSMTWTLDQNVDWCICAVSLKSAPPRHELAKIGVGR